jgi:hypothetical protein
LKIIEAFDKNDTGLIDFEDMKKILLGYGDQVNNSQLKFVSEQLKLRFAKCKTSGIVSEVKNSFTTVFSVLQNLEKPTWFGKKKKKFFFGVGFCPFCEFCQKTGFLDFFQLKKVRMRHPAYILNQRRKLY